MIFKKEGLAGGKIGIDPEIPVSAYKGYEYTTEDARRQFKKYLVTYLTTNKSIKLINGFIYIDDVVLDLSDYSIANLLAALTEYGVKVEYYKDLEIQSRLLHVLPATMLTNFNNQVTVNLGGDISPIIIPKSLNNKSVLTESSTFSAVHVIDSRGNKLPYKVNNDKIFFEPSDNTLIYLTERSTRFGLYIDFAPRRLESKLATAHLLNYRETSKDEL